MPVHISGAIYLCAALFLSLILIYDFISSKIDFTFITISQLLFFSVAVTCCPVEHINKPLKSEAKRKKMKFMSIAVGFIFSTIGLILICTNNNIGVIILLTQILVSILIIVAKIKKGGASHEKNNRFAKMLKTVVKFFALAAYGATSYWGGYQMKEPENIYKK